MCTQVLGRALATAYRHHIDDTDPVTDVPTIRCLRRILTDYEPMLEWAEAAIAAYMEGGPREPTWPLALAPAAAARVNRRRDRRGSARANRRVHSALTQQAV